MHRFIFLLTFFCYILGIYIQQKKNFHKGSSVYSNRKFQCLECSYAALSNADLKKHNLIHTGERPHACSICGQRFSIKGNLKRHIVAHLRDTNLH